MVSDSVIFGLLSAMAFGVSDLLAALVVRRFGVLRTASWVHLVAVTASTLYLLPSDGTAQVSSGQWLALAGLGVLGFLMLIGFYKALQLGPVAIIAPILAAHAAVAMIMATIFLDERLDLVQTLGVAAAICGVVLASMKLNRVSPAERLIGLGVMLGLGVSLGAGLWQYSIGVLSKELGWFTPIYMVRLMIAAMTVPAVVAGKQWPWQGVTRRLLLIVTMVGLLEMAGMFAFARGAEVGVISIVAAASTAYPVVPILGGLIIFKERLGWNQWVGLSVAGAGLLAISLTS